MHPLERSVRFVVDDGDDDSRLRLIDQRLLPATLSHVECRSAAEVADSITRMVVRGAPAIGAAGAYGCVLAAFQTPASATAKDVVVAIRDAKQVLDAARPTASNLAWATQRVLSVAESLLNMAAADAGAMRHAVLQEATELAEEDVRANMRLGELGAALLPNDARVIHHCNTGHLATVGVGTALGIIYTAHAQGQIKLVYVDETRPRLQGARLTCWELMRAEVPLKLIVDSASGSLMRKGEVDAVLFGADRVALNGDLANKIGTYNLCVVAHENNVPVYAAVPTSTIDLTCPDGDAIEIEERSEDEVACFGGTRTAPAGVPVFNPAFDVTPFRYLTAIITEEGVCHPPFEESLSKAKAAAEERIKRESVARRGSDRERD